MGHDVFRPALIEFLAEIEHEDMFGQGQDDRDEMLDHQDRGAAGMDRPEHVHQVDHVALGRSGHHLVEQQQPRPGRQRPREFELFLVAQGQGARQHSGLFRQSDQ